MKDKIIYLQIPKALANDLSVARHQTHAVAQRCKDGGARCKDGGVSGQNVGILLSSYYFC